MSATTTPPPRQTRPLPGLPSPRRLRTVRRVAIAAGLLVMLALAPVVLLAGAGNPPCTTGTSSTPTSTTPSGGRFAAPLELQAGRWYRVGATSYGGPSDPTSGLYGSSGAYLPGAPDSFAELSLLDSNPADQPGGSVSFSDADALGALPYGTALRVVNGTRSRVLFKRDIGYGQGPGQMIPYRIDVWWQSAQKLGITKTPVQIQLLPQSGTGAVLGQLATTTDGGCAPAAAASGPLPPLNATSQTQINPDGTASAPQESPQAVKLAVGAANQIADTPYPVPDAHYDGQNLTRRWPAYDCSATVSYVLYRAGLRGATATASTGLMSYGRRGPGRWISIYANTQHTWIVIAGRAFDTSHYGGPAVPAGTGPRWLSDPTGNLADGQSYVVRHPTGL